jgi:hypothetical protein
MTGTPFADVVIITDNPSAKGGLEIRRFSPFCSQARRAEVGCSERRVALDAFESIEFVNNIADVSLMIRSIR